MRAYLKKHVAKTLKKRVSILAYGVLLVYLGLNLGASQIVSPLYFQMLSGEKESYISFLTAIKTLPEFDQKLILYKNLFGSDVEAKVFAQDNERDALIKKLERFIEKGPNQRDILYSLYLLYLDKGDLNRADVYLKKAKDVDPTIKQF